MTTTIGVVAKPQRVQALGVCSDQPGVALGRRSAVELRDDSVLRIGRGDHGSVLGRNEVLSLEDLERQQALKPGPERRCPDGRPRRSTRSVWPNSRPSPAEPPTSGTSPSAACNPRVTGSSRTDRPSISSRAKVLSALAPGSRPSRRCIRSCTRIWASPSSNCCRCSVPPLATANPAAGKLAPEMLWSR